VILSPRSLGLFLAILLLPLFSSRAALVIETSNLGIRLSTGTELTDATVALGYFTGGFTPTLSNYVDWSTNFLGVDISGATPTVKIGGNTGFYFKDFNPDLSLSLPTGVNGVGEQYAALNPVGARLYLIGVNLAVTEPGTINGATEAFILTDATWTIPTFTISNLTPDTILTITSSTTAAIGQIDPFSGSNYIATMAVIPEPSSMSLMVMGLASVLAFRRKALAKREKCV